ncbi:UPF0545 protein C22orf39 homolog [Physella acuta]|uniref:UPF0545 protein C22orf39 homolog n=1 Tax=Physella acuta TaxID=109671 RepID=UPI0027DC1F52|nr:UPF0545 protein C22orf39 homolog [Physella acuta]
MADKQPQSITSDLPSDIWLIRTCEIYKDEYNDCKTFLSKLYQHYIDGGKQDCSQWLTDYNNCMLFRNKKDKEAAEALIEVERQRRKARLQSAKNNDIWEYRTKPPTEWFKPLSTDQKT